MTSLSLHSLHATLSSFYATELISKSSVLVSQDASSHYFVSFIADTIEHQYHVELRAEDNSRYHLTYRTKSSSPHSETIESESLEDALLQAVAIFDLKRDSYLNENEEDLLNLSVDDVLESPTTPNLDASKGGFSESDDEEVTAPGGTQRRATRSSEHRYSTQKGSHRSALLSDSYCDESEDSNVILIDDGGISDKSTLQLHVDITKQFFGEDSVEYMPGEVVKIKLNVKHLEEEIQKHYMASTDLIQKRKPICFALEFPSDYANLLESNASAPKVVYKKEDYALEEQLVNISRRFLEERWKSFGSGIDAEDETDKSSLVTEDKLAPPHHLHGINPERDARLRYLQDHQIMLNVSQHSSKDDYNSSRHEIVKSYLYQHKSPEFAAAISLFCANGDLQKAYNTLQEVSSGSEYEQLFSTELDLSALDSTETPHIPNILLELYTYLVLRIPTLTHTCAICDSIIEQSNMMAQQSPTICTHFGCLFQYVEQGVCSSVPMSICPTTILADLQRNPAVCDLLVTLCYSVAVSDRRNLLFEPFPPQYVQNDVKNFDAVVDALKKFPPIEKMVRGVHSERKLKEKLGSECYELLRFILTSQRKGILPLASERALSEMKTEYQYLLAVDDPKKRAEFEKLKKKFGSYFAFHGTRSECLHSILRKGLVVGSGTRLQTSGAVYGAGCYFSPLLSTSLGFARASTTSWPQSMFNAGTLQFMILCEIAKDPSAGNHLPNPHHVIKSTDAVCTRMFLIYPNSANVGKVDLRTNKEMEDKIRAILPTY